MKARNTALPSILFQLNTIRNAGRRCDTANLIPDRWRHFLCLDVNLGAPHHILNSYVMHLLPLSKQEEARCNIKDAQRISLEDTIVDTSIPKSLYNQPLAIYSTSFTSSLRHHHHHHHGQRVHPIPKLGVCCLYLRLGLSDLRFP